MSKPTRSSLPPGVTVRRARLSDAAFAETLYFGTMLPLLTALGHGDPQALHARFARGYRSTRSRILGAAAADIGWIQVTATPTGLHLDQIHLVPGWCGRGIGSVLLGRLQARAARSGRDVTLDVIHGNPAAVLYRRRGFTVTTTDFEKSRMMWRPPAP